MDDVVEKEKDALEKLKLNSKSFFLTFLTKYRKLESVKLGDICRPKQWLTIPKSQFTKKGYVVFGANGQIGFYDKFNHKDSTIIITCRGANCGNVHLAPPKCYITGNAMSLDELNENLFDKEFLYYVLRHLNLNGIITGSAQPQIIREDVNQFKVNKLLITEQKMISSKMNQLEDAIKTIQLSIKNSFELQKSLINEIFSS